MVAIKANNMKIMRNIKSLEVEYQANQRYRGRVKRKSRVPRYIETLLGGLFTI